MKKNLKSGRPENYIQGEAFSKTCEYFEKNDDEQLTISDLVKMMEEIVDKVASSYDRRHMKRKLLEYYGDSIVISGEDGKSDIVTLKETADSILRKYYEKPKNVDINLQKKLIIEAAANIIKNDIKGW